MFELSACVSDMYPKCMIHGFKADYHNAALFGLVPPLWFVDALVIAFCERLKQESSYTRSFVILSDSTRSESDIIDAGTVERITNARVRRRDVAHPGTLYEHALVRVACGLRRACRPLLRLHELSWLQED